MLRTSPLYLPAPTPIPPLNCTSNISGRSRGRHFLGASHQLWTIRTVCHQNYCNNAIDRSRLPVPTSLQRWAFLLRSSRHQLQTLVPVTVATSRGLGQSSAWSSRSRASGDHELPPSALPLPSHSPHYHHMYASPPEVRNDRSYASSSPFVFLACFPIPSVRFLLFLSLWFPVVLCVLVMIFPQTVIFYCRAVLRALLYTSSVCMQLVLLCNSSPFLFS